MLATVKSWRAQALVLLAGDAGLRRGEIMALEQTDIDYTRKLINIERSEYDGVVGPPKSGIGRRVPMTSRLAALLKANQHEDGNRILYRRYHNEQLTLNDKAVAYLIGRIEEAAGLDVTQKIHILRHTFCSHLAMRGATLIQIKELAGHTEVMTTQKYMHLSPANADQAIKLLEKGHS